MKLRSEFSVRAVSPRIVYIIDHDHGMSVTNDAENVVRYLFLNYGDRRVIYKDTMGMWSELKHNHGDFVGYAPVNIEEHNQWIQ